MNKGDQIMLKEPVIVAGSFGSEYLPKDTKGILIGERNNLAEIKTKHDTFCVPVESIKSAEDEAA